MCRSAHQDRVLTFDKTLALQIQSASEAPVKVLLLNSIRGNIPHSVHPYTSSMAAEI